MTDTRTDAGRKTWATPSLDTLSVDLTAVAAKTSAAPDGGAGSHSKS